MEIRFLTLILFAVLPIFGQNSITVAATRNASAQPDLIAIGVDVTSALDASRDDVLSALQGSVITAANFSSVRSVVQYLPSGTQSTSTLEWIFTLTAPLANFKTTIAQLGALQQILVQKKNGMALSYSIQGTQLSTQAQQHSRGRPAPRPIC